METSNKVQNNRYSREEKHELILLWQQSGITRKKFCEEQSLNYNTFGTWLEPQKEKKISSAGFAEVKVQATPMLFAQLHLPGGVKIDFYQSVPVAYFQSLLRK